MDSRNKFSCELRELGRLAVPLAAFHAGSQLMGLVDTAIVGRLGAAALGAVGLANLLLFAITVVGMGILMGLDPLVAQALGARDAPRARRLLWQGIWLALLVSMVLSIPALALIALLGPLGISPEVAALARPYMAIRLLGLVPLLLFVGARSYLQAVGKTRPMVISMVAGNVFNFLTALLLVFGGSNLPWWTGPLRLIPALGVIGAATATTLCSVLQLVILARAVRAVQVVGHVRSSRRPDRADMTRGFWVGLPIGLQMGAEVGIFALVAVLAGRLGTDALAAHQVATTLAGFTFTVAIGIGTAGSVRVGRAVGARDIPGTRRAGLAAFAGGAGFMVFSALCFWSFPSAVARTVTDKPEVIAAVVPLLLVAAFFQLSDGIQAVGAGVLRGAGDTRFPFLANVVGHYAIGLPVAVGLGFFGGMGIIGLWWGLCAGLTAVGVALLSRFLVLSSRPIKPLGAHPEPPAFTPDGQMA